VGAAFPTGQVAVNYLIGCKRYATAFACPAPTDTRWSLLLHDGLSPLLDALGASISKTQSREFALSIAISNSFTAKCWSVAVAHESFPGITRGRPL